MDFSVIGKKIKELRKSAGFSQKDLAKDICTQAQISKIENGDVLPLASTLYFISQRLGVDINYFFEHGTTPRLDYVQEVKNQLKMARRKLDYPLIKEIVEIEEKNPLFTSNKKNFQILLWHKGIYKYHVDHQIEEALLFIDRAVDLTFEKVWSEREIEILNSKGILLYEVGRYTDALDIYLRAMSHLGEIVYLNDETIRSRILYNAAKTYTDLEDYDHSTKLCHKAIEICLEKDQLFLLGHLHYHIGYNYELREQFVLAKKYMEQALDIFRLQRDERYNDFISGKVAIFDRNIQ
ncbi:helix-turn-helix transcriptional regulator [Bacillus sp. CMF12]|uniref:helix-turn-helix domain-containing protein n=1 Tax=Bacillaceae TaxID=186817 RepID=UPI001FB44827|nr:MULTISPECIES: helix-turn-helix domain-containing protein [Bacillaceae]UOE55189.1 helix-turn-helix transcriptional regulator [Cytobacillus oceanisediminis]USK49640.1 helix-turn-helix transcriptional regulator [Bacillus sp. CMF12]